MRHEAAKAAARARVRPERSPGVGRSNKAAAAVPSSPASPPARAVVRLTERVDAAGVAFDRERYGDVRRLLKEVVELHPESAPARELYGLALYRLGRFRAAAVELEAHRVLTNVATHLPVLSDCYRALRRFKRVDELWTELREASPSAPLVAEGRIVAAGALADQGKLRDAIVLLAMAEPDQKRPREHHVRLWYALADLYDRAGEQTRARALFRRVREAMPGYADVDARLHALGR